MIAGCNVFLAADLVSAEDEPTGNFHRALEGYETLLLAADTIIQFGMTEGAIDLRNKAGRLADWCEQTRKLLIKTHQAIPDPDKPGGIVAMQHRAYVPASPPLVGLYHLPLSTQYRLAGKIQGEYMATFGPGGYVLIPADDCRLVDGGPYCEYHGSTVTRSSGVH